MRKVKLLKPVDKPPKLVEWLQETKELENNDPEAAIREYKKIVFKFPLNETAYNRLMIIYRKTKIPELEMSWINKGISVFEKKFDSGKAHPNAKVTSLSKSIVRSVGLTDKKGKYFFQPQPVARWLKRKELLEKRAK